MKKVIIIIILMVVLVIPVCVYGDTFIIPETDIIMTLDEDIWMVFTRKNIKNKELLEEYGLSYEQTNKFFELNNVYLQSFAELNTNDVIGATIELYVYKTKITDDIKALIDLNEESVVMIENELVTSVNATKHDYYTNDNNTYIYYEFLDKDTHVANYFTIINGNNYYFSFRSSEPFSDEVIKGMDNIIDSIMVKPSYNINILETIIYAIMAIIIMILVIRFTKKHIS